MAQRATSVRLVATDLDGTLLRPDGTVSQRTAEAVRAARAAGVHVVPVTGRPPRAIWDVARSAGLGPLGVCANGAALVDVGAMEVVELQTIEAEVAASLVERLRSSFPGAVFAVEQSHRLAYEPGFFEADRLWEDLVLEVEDILAALSPATFKLIVRKPGCAAKELLAYLSGAARKAGQAPGAASQAPPGEATSQSYGPLWASGAVAGPASEMLVGDEGLGTEGGTKSLPVAYELPLSNGRSQVPGTNRSQAVLEGSTEAAWPYLGTHVVGPLAQPGDAQHRGRFSVTSSGLDWVEIAAAGISKAYGTWRLCQRLGVDRSEVLAVGDYYNDLPLLSWAAHTAAPSNALPEVLEAAQQVVPSNADDGVAHLLESLVAGTSG